MTIEQKNYLKNDKNSLENSIKRMLYSKINEIYPENIDSLKEKEDDLLNDYFNRENKVENEIKNLDKISVLLTL